MSTESLTIADLQSQGFIGFYVTCADPMCRYSTPIRFESLGLNPSTLIRDQRNASFGVCGMRVTGGFDNAGRA